MQEGCREGERTNQAINANGFDVGWRQATLELCLLAGRDDLLDLLYDLLYDLCGACDGSEGLALVRHCAGGEEEKGEKGRKGGASLRGQGGSGGV